jgi:hypothetical protein
MGFRLTGDFPTIGAVADDDAAHPTQEGPMMTDGRPRAPLPLERAFVVQLRADADLGSGAISGRIEHLSSGAAALFDSVDELIAWMHGAIVRTSSTRSPRGAPCDRKG